MKAIPTMSRLFTLCAIASQLLRASVANGAQPNAISVPVLTNWLGNDGSWSPVTIRVGTPPQWLDVLPSTASQETWVVGKDGCGALGTSICSADRGGLFLVNESSSWQSVGDYELGLDPQLFGQGSGYYGYDSVALSETVSMPSQIISVLNDTQYWLGILGLGTKASNFTDENKPTFLSSLANGTIPSLTYSYTAGAIYMLKQVPASLVLGGYDASRYYPNNVSFSLDPNQYPVVSLNQLSVSATAPVTASNSSKWAGNNSVVLLEPADADLFTIDSSTPLLWLPGAVCARFEEAFGLEYNDVLELYLLNATQQQDLEDLELAFNFEIADLPGSTNKVSIDLTYKALNLALSYGYPKLTTVFPEMNSTSPNVPYFPLRKAANSSQYTIGRAFLQESYLIVDYDRNNFSISQAKFSANAIQNQTLVNIYPPSGEPPSSAGPVPAVLKTSTWIGIGVGAVGGLIVITILLSYCLIRRRRRQDVRHVRSHNTSNGWLKTWFVHEKIKPLISEIDGSGTQKPAEMCGQEHTKELATDFHRAIELPSGSTFQDEKSFCSTTSPLDHDPANPVELPTGDLPTYGQRNAPLQVSPVSQSSPQNSEFTIQSTLLLSPMSSDRTSFPATSLLQGTTESYPSAPVPNRPFSWEL